MTIKSSDRIEAAVGFLLCDGGGKHSERFRHRPVSEGSVPMQRRAFTTDKRCFASVANTMTYNRHTSIIYH